MNPKQWILGGLLLVALFGGALGGFWDVGRAQGRAGTPAAYADDLCGDNNLPPPGVWPCTPTPTATPVK